MACVSRKIERVREFKNYLLDGGLDPLDDVLCVEVELRNIFIVLGKGLSGDGELSSINQVGVLEQVLDQGGDTASFVEILHDILS